MYKFWSGALRKQQLSDEGVTLIEILVALVITTLIAVVITRVTMDASNGLATAADESISNQQSLLFTQTIQYDVRASQDVFVFGDAFPQGNSNLCTSGNSSTWSSDGNNFSKPLFTILLNDVVYDKSFTSTTPWTDPVSKYVGYDLKKAAANIGNEANSYQIWRNECSDNNGQAGAITKSDLMINLGDTLCADASGATFYGISSHRDLGKSNCLAPYTGSSGFAPQGNQMLFCGDFNTPCQPSASTKSVTNYSFTLPYAGCRIVLVNITNNPKCSIALGDSRLNNPLSNMTRRLSI